MKKVFKYELKHGEAIKLPKSHEVVHAGMQNAKPYIWAEVYCEDSPICERLGYVICATGQELPPFACHVKTIMDGPFVWHVYRIINK